MLWISTPLEDELANLVDSESRRLVTVFGLGGSGASSLVARALPSFHRVDLSDLRRASSVWARLRDVHARSVWLDQVHRAYLVRPAVERWLARNEGRIVISSREPLGLSEEHRLPIPPLGTDDARELLETELVRLGQRRPEGLPALIDMLDGWPLALRAAAMEARVHGCSRVALERLHEASRDVRAVLEQTWDDLGSREKAMLGALSLSHSAIATRDVAKLVPAGEATLSRLVDRSLARAMDGQVRVPVVVARFVRSRISASGTVGAMNDARRNRARLLLLAGARAKAKHRSDPEAASAELERLREDLLALSHESDARTSVAAGLLLEPLLVGRLERDEVLTLWQRITHLARGLPAAPRADVALALTRTLIHRGDHESAERLLLETKALSARPVTAIYRSIYLAHISAWRGLTDEAALLLDAASRDIGRGSPLTRDEASALTEDTLVQRAFVALQRGDLHETERYARECASLASRGPTPRLGALARRFSAEVLLRRGAAAAAVPLFTLTRDELFRFGDHTGALFVWSRLVEALRAAGDPRAADEARAAAALAARAGEAVLELSVLGGLERAEVSPPRVSELGWRSQIPSLRADALKWLAADNEPRAIATLRIDAKTHRAWLSDRTVSFARRLNLWRILRALVDGHARSSTLSNATLFDAGWPGERAEPASQKQRVHTAIWTLRRALLGSLLETRPEGYAIAQAVEIGRSDAGL